MKNNKKWKYIFAGIIVFILIANNPGKGKYNSYVDKFNNNSSSTKAEFIDVNNYGLFSVCEIKIHRENGYDETLNLFGLLGMVIGPEYMNR